MRLVDDNQIIVRKIIHQGVRRILGRQPRKMHRVVLDARADAGLAKHLDIVVRALRDALKLQKLIVRAEILSPLLKLRLDVRKRPLHLLRLHDIVGRREDDHVGKVRYRPSLQRIDALQPVHLIAEKLDAVCLSRAVHGIHLEHIAVRAKCSALKIHLVPLVLDVHEPPHYGLARNLHAGAEGDGHVFVINRAAEPVDTRYARHHDDITPLRKSRRRGVPETVDLVVDVRVLLDVGIGRRNIRLRLVIVVVTHEVFNRIFRKILFELTVQLRRERLVVRNNQCRTVQLCDDIGHRKCLAGPGDAEKRLELFAGAETVHQLRNRLRLVAGRLIRRM